MTTENDQPDYALDNWPEHLRLVADLQEALRAGADIEVLHDDGTRPNAYVRWSQRHDGNYSPMWVDSQVTAGKLLQPCNIYRLKPTPLRRAIKPAEVAQAMDDGRTMRGPEGHDWTIQFVGRESARLHSDHRTLGQPYQKMADWTWTDTGTPVFPQETTNG